MTVVDLYTIQILRDPLYAAGYGNLDRMLAEMQENLTNLLPEGYRARIRRWNDNPVERNPGDE